MSVAFAVKGNVTLSLPIKAAGYPEYVPLNGGDIRGGEGMVGTRAELELDDDILIGEEGCLDLLLLREDEDEDEDEELSSTGLVDVPLPFRVCFRFTIIFT